MKAIITKSLQDMLSKDVILFVLKMGLIALAITSILTWNMWETLNNIIIVSLLTSLYSEKLLIALAKKRYPDVPVVGSANITTSILLTLKASIIFQLLFMITLPLLFIPMFGQVLVLYLWSILLKEPTIYDVGALFINDKKVLKEKKKKTRVLAMVAALFNYVPLVNIFAPVFAQILFLHHILGEEK